MKVHSGGISTNGGSSPGGISTNGGSAPPFHFVQDDTTGAAIPSLAISASEPTKHDATSSSFHHDGGRGPTGYSTAAVVVPDDAMLLESTRQAPVPTRHQNHQLSHAVTFDADEALVVAPTGAVMSGSNDNGNGGSIATGMLQFAKYCGLLKEQLRSAGLCLSDKATCDLVQARLQFLEAEYRLDCRDRRKEELEERHRREDQNIAEHNRREDREDAERRHRDVLELAKEEKDWRIKVDKAQARSFTRIASSSVASLLVLLIIVAFYRGSQLLEGVTWGSFYTFIADKCPREAPKAATTAAGGYSLTGYFFGSVGGSVSQKMTDAFADVLCILTTVMLCGMALVGVMCIIGLPVIPFLVKVVFLGAGLIYHLTAWRAWAACFFLFGCVCCAYIGWTCRNFKRRYPAAAPKPKDLNGLYATIDDVVVAACMLPPLFAVAAGFMLTIAASDT